MAEGAGAHAFGREQVDWFDRVENEFDNLRAALTWSLETETGLQLVASLGWFFTERGHWSEGLEWLERILAANPDAPPALRAKALHGKAALSFQPGDRRQARTYLEQALVLARATQDRWNTAWALSWLGLLEFEESAASHAAALLDESLALFRELDDPMGLTHTLIRRSWVARAQSDSPYMLAEARTLAHDAGDCICAGWVALDLGVVALDVSHDFQQARYHFETSLATFRDARFTNGYGRSLLFLIHVEQAAEHWERAQSLMDEIRISLHKNSTDRAFLRLVLYQFAGWAWEREEHERATTLLGATNSPDLVGMMATSEAKAETDSVIEIAMREELGEADYAEVWAVGNAMTYEQAVAYAFDRSIVPGAQDDSATTSAPPNDLLNKRALEVLALVADGLTNREIAGELFLAVNTVKWYLKEIYSKLDVANRTEAVSRAQVLGILS